MKYAPGHPLAGVNGYVSEARWVLFEKVGPGEHSCRWCGETVRWMTGIPGSTAGGIVADHPDGNPLNDSPDNLVVSCGGCNGTRGHWVTEAEPHRVRTNGTRLRGVQRTCECCGAAFVAWETRPGKGRFCSRSCARTKPKSD